MEVCVRLTSPWSRNHIASIRLSRTPCLASLRQGKRWDTCLLFRMAHPPVSCNRSLQCLAYSTVRAAGQQRVATTFPGNAASAFSYLHTHTHTSFGLLLAARRRRRMEVAGWLHLFGITACHPIPRNVEKISASRRCWLAN